MWQSGKPPPKPRQSKLPPSERQLFWAKSDREVSRTQFRLWESSWASKTRKPPVEVEKPPTVSASMPAWMNYRAKPTKAAPLYFRTKSVEKKPK